MYLSGPHLFSIAGLVMGMTFFFVFTAYSVLVSHTSSAASYLWLAFAALLVAMVYLRLYAKEATEYACMHARVRCLAYLAFSHRIPCTSAYLHHRPAIHRQPSTYSERSAARPPLHRPQSAVCKPQE